MEGALNDLQTVLQNKYGFIGKLHDTDFSNDTSEAFAQLVKVLKAGSVKKGGISKTGL